MRHATRPAWALAILLGAGLLSPTAVAQQAQLTMGIISPRNPQMLKESYRPLKEYLERETGTRIELEPVISYATGQERLKDRRWDLAFATNETYLESRQVGYQVLVSVTEHGRDYYRSVLVVNEKSPIRRLAQLKGKRIAFVSRKSASGYLYPMKLLLDGGLSPAKDMHVAFTGNARIIGHTIANPGTGRLSFDAGAVYDGFLSENAREASRLRVLAESVPIPHIPVIASPRLAGDRALVGKFRQAFLNVARVAPEVLKQPEIFFDGFKPPRPGIYEQVQTVRAQVQRYEKQHPLPERTR